MGVLSYPHCRAGGPLGGRRGTARRPRGGVEDGQRDRPQPLVRQAHDREGVVPLGPCPGKVALPSDDPRVTCTRPGGGKTLRALGYELPHPVG